MNEAINIKGTVTITIHDEAGNPIRKIVNRNLVVRTGLEFFVNRILDLTNDELDQISIGTGTSPASLSDTDLEGTVYDKTIQDKVIDTLNSLVVNTKFTDNNDFNGLTVAEIGLFTDTGILVARTVLDASQRFIKENSRDVSVYWQITIG